MSTTKRRSERISLYVFSMNNWLSQKFCSTYFVYITSFQLQIEAEALVI